ncbi:MAG: helix-turn-helix domain-containing protein [Acidimicrobiales bacterium]|jgi:predicted transcriptional regulator
MSNPHEKPPAASSNLKVTYSEPRELTDPKTLRALTHPVRLALLEVLTLEGPLTATEAGELIGESSTTCSFHFRQLAKYGFVEEAGHGPGRQRPWKLVHIGMSFSDVNDDPEMTIAAKSLEKMMIDRAFGRLQNFYNTRASYPTAWQKNSGSYENILHVTVEELKQVEQECSAIFTRFRDRLADPTLRPHDSLPVEVLLFGFPMRLPEAAQ